MREGLEGRACQFNQERTISLVQGMDLIRVSSGSAAVLGLRSLKMIHKPTTIHLLQYTPSGCKANCGFCPQAKDSMVEKSHLSRVTWPEFSWKDVLERLIAKYEEGVFSRVCLQTVIHATFVEDMLQVVQDLAKSSINHIPVSIALVPVAKSIMEKLKSAHVDRVGIALDAATPALFSEIKGEVARGPYTWEGHWNALQDALAVFGRNHVSTHLIVGLGETESEIIERMQQIQDAGITIGLFAFTAIPGTRLEKCGPPELASYRRIQLARYLIISNTGNARDFQYNASTGAVINWGMTNDEVIALLREKNGRMFETSGCPGCNRPYYNESPRGPIFNHPSTLSSDELDEAITLLFPEQLQPSIR